MLRAGRRGARRLQHAILFRACLEPASTLRSCFDRFSSSGAGSGTSDKRGEITISKIQLKTAVLRARYRVVLGPWTIPVRYTNALCVYDIMPVVVRTWYVRVLIPCYAPIAN